MESLQEVYHIAKITGRYNLLISVLGRNLEDIERFVEKEIRRAPGVDRFEVYIGEIPSLPKTVRPRL